MSWLSRLIPVRSLDRVGRGGYCVLPVHVVSPDAVESSIAPMRGAALRWTLLYEETLASSQRAGGGYTRPLRAFATGWRGGPLVVRAACGRTIEVALDRARLSAPIDPEDGTPLGLDPRAAAIYGALAARAPDTAGPLYVREHVITSGQPVILRGRIEPIARAGSDRDAPAFRAGAELVIEDRALR